MNFRKHVIVLILLCLGLAHVGSAAVGNAASLRLQETKLFAFGGIGFAGTTSSGELALREILKSDSSSAIFMEVFEKSTPEGKCYALVALREISPDLFKKCSDIFRKNLPSQVHTMSGCLGEEIAGWRALAEIETGTYTKFIPKKKEA